MTLIATTSSLVIDVSLQSTQANALCDWHMQSDPTGPAMDWQQASEEWLACQRSGHTRRAYQFALNDFLDATGGQPWSVRMDDILKWIASMQAAGLSQATIGQRIAACSSFYNFVCTQYIHVADNGFQFSTQKSLFANFPLRFGRHSER